MRWVIDPQGQVLSIYQEEVDLACLGRSTVRRASQVEPDEAGAWWADLSPVSGPRLGPFSLRSQAVEAEVHWLEANLPNLS